MNRILIIISFASLLPGAVWAQKNRQLQAIVAGSAGRQPVPDATVTLFRAPDSLPYEHTLTGKNGHFLFRRLDTGRYTITVSATSHVPLRIDVHIQNNKINIPDTLFLAVSYKQEDMVVIRGLINPVTVKKDTLEFNPAAFRTPQDDAIEELIKKIPGFTLDTDGSLKYNGEEVKEIMVDGKPFALDPNLPVTKILPVHLIDRIQLIDQRPKDQKYNKNDDGQRVKVLNLTIKKDKKHGWFGKSGISAGSNRLKEANGNLTRFNKERKYMLNARLGNTGQQGNNQVAPGRNRNFSIGGGYQDSWKKDMNLAVNTSLNNNRGENFANSVRTTFLPGDTSLTAQNESRNYNVTEGKTVGIRFSNEPDSTQNYSVDANLNFNSGTSGRESFARTQNHLNNPVNHFRNSSTATNKSENANFNFSYNKQLDTFGRGLSFQLGVTQMNYQYLQHNFSENTFFETNGSIRRIDSIDQERQNNNRNTSQNLSLNYHSPLLKKLNLNVHYGLMLSTVRSGINVYDRDKNSKEYNLFNDTLSNGFSTRSISHYASLAVGIYKKRVSFSLQLGVTQQVNRNKNFDSLFTEIQRFVNFNPGFNLNFYKKQGANIRITYNGQTSQPSIQQRQPVIDNTNPLYLRLGNPGLRPEYNNQLNINLNRNYPRSFISYSIVANISNTFNKITESVSFNSEGRQVTFPVNLSGAYNASLWGNLGFPVSRKKKSNAGLSVNMRQGRTISLLNGQRNTANNFSAGSGINITAGIKEWANINGGINYSYTETVYSASNRGNISFNNISISLNTTFLLKHDWDIQSQCTYTNRGSRVQFGRETTIWNLGINKKFWKKRLIAGFRVQDLLKQQVGYNRNTGANYVEESNNAVIGRYFMATLSYNLNNFGGRVKYK